MPEEVVAVVVVVVVGWWWVGGGGSAGSVRCEYCSYGGVRVAAGYTLHVL